MASTVTKNQTANVGKYSYKYVDIAQIHFYLESIGASYYQYIDRLEGDDYIMTVKVIDGKESAPLRGCKVVDAKLIGTSNPAQEQGSAITYARRYSLLMAFGLATEDDDAQSLSKPKKTEARPKVQPEANSQVQPEDSVIVKKAKLRALMTSEQWQKTIDKFGDPTSWTEEQVDKWTTSIKNKGGSNVQQSIQ